jgi:hypothetical protein
MCFRFIPVPPPPKETFYGYEPYGGSNQYKYAELIVDPPETL